MQLIIIINCSLQMHQEFIKLRKCSQDKTCQEHPSLPELSRTNSITKIIQSYEELLKSLNAKIQQLTIDLQLTRSKLLLTETRYATLLDFADGFDSKKQLTLSLKQTSFEKLLDRIDELQKKLISQNAQILRYKSRLIKQKKINENAAYKQIGSDGQAAVQKSNLASYFNFEAIRDDFMITSRKRKNSVEQQYNSLPWQRALQNFNDEISSPTKFKQKTVEFVKKFIPHEQRCKVWPLIFENQLGLSDSLYIELLERRSKDTIQSHIISQIQRDITRSFNNKTILPYKQALSMELQEMLQIFHLLRPDISYVQGMTYPAIILTIVVGKIEAFKIFSNLLLCNKFFRNMYTFQENWIQVSCKAFQTLLKDWNSEISKHLQNLQIKPEIFLVEWFFTIFSRGLSLQTTLKLWDLIGYQRELILYRICLSIFESIGKRLLGQNYEHTVGLIQSYWSYIDENKLLQSIVNSKLTQQKLTRVFNKCKKEIKQRQKQKSKKMKEKRVSIDESGISEKN